jgi:GntR family transcriptional regulator of abcA and norABC
MLFKEAFDHLAGRIDRGDWKAHDKLPSVREMALELGMNRLTVLRAYQLLKTEGKAYVKEKSGYYVHSADQPVRPDAIAERHPIASRSRLKNALSEIQELPATYQFSQAVIDPNLLPNLFLSEYVKKVFDIYPKLMGTYSTVQGDKELRQSLSHYMGNKHRVQLDASHILITTGSQQAIDLVARAFVRPMDAILVERPTYSSALDIFRFYGARMFTVEITPGGYDLDEVEELMKLHKPRLFYLNPTYHNPTGYTVPASQRKQLVDLAERYRCLIVVDDAFQEMYFDEPPPQPMFAYDTEGWVVHLRSFSKYVAPGLRICAVVGRKPVIDPLITAKSLADNGTPLVIQKIFLHYFESERLQKHIEKLRTALQMKRDIAEEELAESGWKWVRPQGGLTLWVKLPDGFPVDTLLQESLKQSIAFVPGSLFDPHGEMNSWIRLCYSFVNEGQLRTGIRRLIEVAAEVGKRG